jgi:hypothetical protein
MIIEGEYFYKHAIRLSWGFGSPNQLGAFVAAIVPAAWAVASVLADRCPIKPHPAAKRSSYLTWPFMVRTGVYLIEFGLWIAIGATASRGAAVAAICAALAWSVFGVLSSSTRWQDSITWSGLRVAMCIGGLAIFSFGGRIAPEFIAQDKSIGNRFILWSGATDLIAASPWSGWGAGESGNAFMQWIQPLSHGEGYKTMVNSFLHVGVEHGLLALCLLLFITIAGISWALVCEKAVRSEKIKVLVRASSCIILSWALSNVFSTLFKDWRLWIFPGIAVVVLVSSLAYVRLSVRLFFRWMSLSGGAAVLGVGGIYFFGKYSDAQHAIHIRHPSRELTILSSGAPDDKPRLGMLVDKDVIGKLYGHEIRRWGVESFVANTSWSVSIFDARFWQPASAAAKQIDQWILMGDTAQAADSLGSKCTVVFLHPRGQPPQHWTGQGVVIFNAVDEDGAREHWIQWANRQKLRIVTVQEVGLDAREKWPSAYTMNFPSAQ